MRREIFTHGRGRDVYEQGDERRTRLRQDARPALRKTVAARCSFSRARFCARSLDVALRPACTATAVFASPSARAPL